MTPLFIYNGSMIPALYLHIPFCKRKCVYCNFYSQVHDTAKASAFVDTVISRLERLDRDLYSIYVGGGTPSVLDGKNLARLLLSLKRFSVISHEFTVEANPESLDDDKIKLLFDHGVNRLSIGVQSLDERKLAKLGRLHSAAKATEAVLLARKRGFKNISADLIFGVWGESPEDWKKELDEFTRLPINHASCYELTYEKGTPLFSALTNNSLTPLSDEATSAMYGMAIDTLALSGFKQYEVSNFAIPGCESKHNMNYWDNNPYIGLGPSAVSYMGGVRSKNVAYIDEYLRRSASGKDLAESSERLSPARSAGETAAVKIRTSDGIDLEWFRARTGFDLLELEKRSLPRLLEDGLIKYRKDGEKVTGICLERKGFLFCDTVSSAFI